VVPSIIGVLASLLFPALAVGKRAAVATECRSNLRDLGFALRMFVDENDYFPQSFGAEIIEYSVMYGTLHMTDWKMPLAPFLGVVDESPSSYLKMRKLRCPQILRSNDRAVGNGQYAYNRAGTAQPYGLETLG
jgi:hypothetical protein